MVGLNKMSKTQEIILALMDERSNMENELQLHLSYLTQNNIGMTEPLTDSNDFPRSDIDVYRVRHARNRIICIRNDLKKIMTEIETQLHIKHAEDKENGDITESSTCNSLDDIQPIVRIGDVTSSSPADRAMHFLYNIMIGENMTYITTENKVKGYMKIRGDKEKSVSTKNVCSTIKNAKGLITGDLITNFGSANSSNFKDMKDLVTIVNNSINKFVKVNIIRDNKQKKIMLKPQKWSGSGLLGCRLIPII